MPTSILHPARRAAASLAALTLSLLGACATAPSPTAPSAAATAPAPIQAAASGPAAASPPTRDFGRWVTAFRTSARASGIDEATLATAFDTARYLPRVIELDRAQPEFTRSVWDYLDHAVTARRVSTGRQKLSLYRAEADAAAAQYGVPPEVLAAVWGIESNFGADYGDMSVIDALATLGFDGRREAWARGQLLAALEILQRGDVDRAHMIGSWAGAMGQTQFIPTVFLAYAVDADHDGRRDIWGSMADVMASTGNFLAHLGWQAGQPWGLEVRLPPGFDPGRADPTIHQSAAQWAAEGVRAASNAPLPPLADASVLLPAGARGPAFLVGPNFQAILGYNNSTSYALAVGLLAQGLAGGGGVQAPWPRDLATLSRSEMTRLQTSLNALGFDSGTPDGLMGPATRSGLRAYQRSIGTPADGYPTRDLLQRLGASTP